MGRCFNVFHIGVSTFNISPQVDLPTGWTCVCVCGGRGGSSCPRMQILFKQSKLCYEVTKQDHSSLSRR